MISTIDLHVEQRGGITLAIRRDEGALTISLMHTR